MTKSSQLIGNTFISPISSLFMENKMVMTNDELDELNNWLHLN